MNDNITKASLGKGGKGTTDWQRVDALTDEDITRAVADDPDSVEPDAGWWAQAMILRPQQPKERITVRLDADMVHWFREQGDGYQTRINAVLRAYYEAQNAKRSDHHRPV